MPSLHPPGVLWADLPAPLPKSVVRHDAAAVGQQILDILEAQAISVLHPDGVADAVRRNALPKVAESSRMCIPALCRAERDPDKAVPVYARRGRGDTDHRQLHRGDGRH